MLGRREKDGETADAPAASDASGSQGSVVARGMKVLGDLVTDGALRIEGAVTGSVRARKVHLTESGSIEGDVLPNEGSTGDEVFLLGGRVGGSVRAAEVEIRAGGSVAGPVTANRATIRGRVKGGIVVRDLLALEETAVVEGDIQARRLAIREGGRFDGKVKMTQPSPSKPEPPRASAIPAGMAVAT